MRCRKNKKKVFKNDSRESRNINMQGQTITNIFFGWVEKVETYQNLIEKVETYRCLVEKVETYQFLVEKVET